MLQLKAGLCADCRKKIEVEENERKVKKATLSNRSEIEKLILTTESGSNFSIDKRLGIVSAECAFGMNIFKDLFSGVRDVVGGRSSAVQSVLRDSRKIVLDELRDEAFELGADAVVAIDFEYVDLSNSGNMILLVANGTAVTLKN